MCEVGTVNCKAAVRLSADLEVIEVIFRPQPILVQVFEAGMEPKLL